MKALVGIVVSIAMQKTAVVSLTRTTTHPLYRKLLKRSKKHKVDTGEFTVATNDTVKIVETRPISKDKHFKILEVLSGKPATTETQKKSETQKVSVSKKLSGSVVARKRGKKI